MNIITWSDIFPVMTDEYLKVYDEEATDEFREEAEEWFGVSRIINPSESEHIVSTTLFWKNIDIDTPDLPPPTEEVMRNAREAGIVMRFDPWPQYVEPLLVAAKHLAENRPDVGLRVYLANDMEFLVEQLAPYCEIRLMKSSSIRHAPGSMWRFLAMEDAPKLLTVCGTDNIQGVENQIELSHRLVVEKLGFWRYPATADHDATHFTYRPIIACEWGVQTSLYSEPVRYLLDAFMWHYLKGRFPKSMNHPIKGPLPVFGEKWPGYGFDEWFLIVALYPRLAMKGAMTIVRDPKNSRILPLDIEYVTWHNSDSLIGYV